jgi:hypothetical protein
MTHKSTKPKYCRSYKNFKTVIVALFIVTKLTPESRAQTPISSYITSVENLTPGVNMTNPGHIDVSIANQFNPTVNHNSYFGQRYPGDGVSATTIINGFTIGSSNFNPVAGTTPKPFDKVNLIRINNPAYSGEYYSGFYAISSIRDGSGTSISAGNPVNDATSKHVYIDGVYTRAMEDLINQFSLNYGSDNIFSNIGTGNAGFTPGTGAVRSATGNNIERIDLIYREGIGATTIASLAKLGFLINERGGNDAFKIAAITSVDGSDRVTGLGDIITSGTTHWGSSVTDPSIESAVFMGPYDELKIKQRIPSQSIKGVFISLADLNVSTNTKIYGISIFPNDFVSSGDNINLTDENTILTTSSADGEGGLDMISGAFFAREEDNFEVLAQEVSGKVWNDYDGTGTKNGSENNVSGNATSSGGSIISGGALYVNVLVNDKVVAVVPVNDDGTYVYKGLLPQINYELVLSEVSGTIGEALAPSLPTGWVTTNENLDGTIDNGTPGIISLVVMEPGVNVVNYDFGIERTPLADNKEFLSLTPSVFSVTPSNPSFSTQTGYTSVALNSTYLATDDNSQPGGLTGSDPEDGLATINETTNTFIISQINSNTRLFYDFGAGTGVQEIIPGNEYATIPNFDINKMMIYGGTGSGTTSSPLGFEYNLVDLAGKSSPGATYSLASTSPLPVTLSSFNIRQIETKAVLQWSTSEEVNASHFDVEHSRDGKVFSLAGTVSANELNRKYQFIDNNIFTGTKYYRLKMVDLDHSFAYSRIVSIALISDKKQPNLYPNPASDVIKLNTDGLENVKKIFIYNINGTLISQLSKIDSNEINVSDLSSGMYSLKVIYSSGDVALHKFLIAR